MQAPYRVLVASVMYVLCERRPEPPDKQRSVEMRLNKRVLLEIVAATFFFSHEQCH
jgi:hypothetical protein